ncbi:hypothetical protein BHF68_04765 [Desulfuribacillus alkaliarsenatis]|uniref:peptide-methionine (S)-S-oxide reductase n=1 Tax=Desulfuribacillus alkaliarsenatis TaxID=766136 RepID=A0A1E5G3A6_9FIRM|nr:hypothetical protein BHF68_04765 [Desulfuribacillus alkaliarsenatis]
MTEGVYRTRVGYAGGTTANPTYERIGDHTEVLQIDFNPLEISFEEVVHLFWKYHTPSRRVYSRQYLPILLYHDEKQERVAKKSYLRAEQQYGKIYTQLMPMRSFYLAENYHQKYYLQLDKEIAEEYRTIYPDWQDFINSTATARVNGYIVGYGDNDKLEQEIDKLGLSSKGQERLLRLIRRY